MPSLLGSLLKGVWSTTKFGARTGWGITRGVTGAVFNRGTLQTGMGLAQGAWSLGKFAHKYQAPIGFGIAAGAFAFGAMNYPSVDPKQYAEVRGHSPMQRFQASAQGDLVFGLNKTPDVNISPMAAAYMFL